MDVGRGKMGPRTFEVLEMPKLFPSIWVSIMLKGVIRQCIHTSECGCDYVHRCGSTLCWKEANIVSDGDESIMAQKLTFQRDSIMKNVN